MPNGIKVRWGWLKFMYAYTIAGAGGLALGLLVAPRAIASALGWPDQDPVMEGVVGSVYLGFALLSVLGLRAPLNFAPVLLLQLCYKSVWFLGVAVPLSVAGRLPSHALLFMGIFASYIIGDLIALPFPWLFGRQPES